MKNKLGYLLVMLLVFTGMLFAQIGKQTITPVKSIPQIQTQKFESAITYAGNDTLLNESFEGDLTGWSYADNDGDAWSIYNEDATYDVAHSGTSGVGVLFNPSGNDDWLITPQMALPSTATNITFSLWARSHSDSWLEDFNVKLSTTGNALSGFSVTLGSVTNASATWTQYTYDLTGYTGESVYLALQCVSVDDYYLFADDFLLIAEEGAPTVLADFSADATSGTAPLTVNFTDQSTGATTWEWDFDNDGTLDATADANPSYTYSDAGTYSVSLTVTDGSGTGDTETKTDYIVVTEPAGEAITSTTTGGSWSETTTWVGGVVPTASDNVVIDGTVSVDGDVPCNDLTIKTGKVLQNLGYSDDLEVNGSLSNNGTIRNNPEGYDFTINLHGDLVNAGSIVNRQISFVGATNQTISMTTSAEFNGVYLVDEDYTSTLTAASDLFLTDTELRGNDSSNPTSFILPSGSGFDLSFSGANSNTSNIEITGNGNGLNMSDGAYLSSDTYLADIVLTGTIQVESDYVYFTGPSVVIEDTLQNYGNSDDLQVQEVLNNNGVIRNSPNGYDFNIDLNGDLINNGSIRNYKITMNGTEDQTISMSSTADFTGVILADPDNSSKIIAASDLILHNTEISFNASDNTGELVLPAGSGFGLVLIGEDSQTNYLNLTGNGNSLKLLDGAYLSTYTFLADITLEGIVQIDEDYVYFTGPSVILQDTLQNLGYSDDLQIEGTFTNNGLIRNNPNRYDFSIDLPGNLINNGNIANYRINVNGSANQTITLTGGNAIAAEVDFQSMVGTGDYQWYLNSSAITGEINDHLLLEGLTTADYGAYYCTTDAGDSRTITITGDAPSVTAAFTADVTSGEAPLEVNFTDQSTGATSWEWDFNNDGTIDSDDQNPAYTYNSEGMYTVSLTVSDGTTSDTETKTDFIMVTDGTTNLVADFTADPTAGAAPLTVNFTDASSGSPTSWDWDFGDGNSSTDQNPTHEYTSAGTHTVSLTVSDGDNSDLMTKTDFITVTAGDAIVSTATGGLWNETSTWIGGVVPSKDDDVVIDGNVEVFLKDSCNNLTVNAGDTLLNNGHYSDDLAVMGSLTNNGVIRDNPEEINGYDIDLNGDLVNNGTIANNRIFFTGSGDQTISMSQDAGFIGVDLWDEDSTSSVIAGSDLVLTDVMLYFYDEENSGKLILPAGSGFDLTLTGADAKTNYIKIVANGNSVAMTDGAYMTYGTYVSDAVLQETIQIESTSVFFDGDSVVLQDTLQNLDSSDWPEIWGTFVNYGVIRENPELDYAFGVTFRDSVINEGTITADLDLMSTVDQVLINAEDAVLTSSEVSMWAMTGTSDFQWYKDENPVPDEDLDILTIYDISESDYGTYYCSTDEGDSREITISSPTTAPELIADFTTEPVSGIPPLTVRFTDESMGDPESWNWDFGDGSTSTEQSPTHEYTSVGQFTVQLVVSAGSDTDTLTRENLIVTYEESKDPGGWFMQNPYPTANDINAIEYIDNSTAIAVGAGGLILRTTDAGKSWETIPSGTNEYLQDVDFPSASTGYIGGNNPGYGEPGVMLKTTDGGATWTELTINFNYNINSVSFTDEATGWIVGDGSYSSNGSVSKTTDGGATWIAQDAGFADNYHSVYFIDANNGWVGGWDYVAWTSNGGDTWNPMEIVNTEDILVTDLQFSNASTGYFAGVNYLYKSTDGGQSWNEVTNYPVDNAQQLCFQDGNTGWVSSEDIVRHTSDGGNSWTNVLDVPEIYDYEIQDMDFGGDTGWIVTVGGRIFKFAEDKWTESSSDILPRKNIANMIFIDENSGWLVGSMDNIWATTNGGITWIEQETPAHYMLEGIDFVNISMGWAVGHAPYGGEAKIYHTSDGGANWNEQTSGTGNLLWDVDFVDEDNGWAVGYQGTIVHTTDGGASWSTQSSGTSVTLEDVYFLDTETGWVCGQDGTILYTTDGGDSWNAQSTPEDRNLYGIYFGDAATGFAVGAEAMIIRTTDGGQTWSFLNEGGSFDDPLYSAVNFSDANYGWVTGNDGVILVTTDGGTTWESQDSPTSVDLNAVYFVDNQTGWTVGENGAVLKTTTGGKIPVGIEGENPDDLLVSEFTLHPCYPNPFNPVTSVRYDVPEATEMRVSVYNILGHEVDVLFDGYAEPGRYTIRWDAASQLPSGIYFVRMMTREYSRVQKVTLMK